MKPFKCLNLCYCIIWFNFYYIIKFNKYILLLFQLGQYFLQLPFWNISYWVFANYCLFKTIENLYSQARFLFKSQSSPFYVLEILITFTVCFLLMMTLFLFQWAWRWLSTPTAWGWRWNQSRDPPRPVQRPTKLSRLRVDIHWLCVAYEASIINDYIGAEILLSILFFNVTIICKVYIFFSRSDVLHFSG